MEYGDIVWNNIPDYLKQSLESLQFEAVRIVTVVTKLTSRQLLYDETGCMGKCSRLAVKKYKLLKYHEMFHKGAHDYLNCTVQIIDLLRSTPYKH